jgi:DNA-binding transcriptional ArsR family regulator
LAEKTKKTLMTVSEQPVRSRASSQRVRIATAALLDGPATALVQSVREIICEPTRTQIVRVLSSGPLSVGEIASVLGRSKSATSQHLRVLRDAGIVSPKRRGRTVMYSLDEAPMINATVQVLDRAATLSAA